MPINSNEHVVFFGDSITDCGWDRNAAGSLGDGYVKIIAERMPLVRVTNRGISGNRVYDLEARLDTDVLSLKPDIVSILIGINDTWRTFDAGLASPIPEFQASYRRILERLLAAKCRVVLLEPFLLPIPEDRRAWRLDVDSRIGAIRELAWDFHLPYLPLDGTFASAAATTELAHWLPDGVHPSAAGHELIATQWIADFA